MARTKNAYNKDIIKKVKVKFDSVKNDNKPNKDTASGDSSKPQSN